MNGYGRRTRHDTSHFPAHGPTAGCSFLSLGHGAARESTGSSQSLLAEAENTSQIYLRHVYNTFFIKSAALMKNFVGNRCCDPE